MIALALGVGTNNDGGIPSPEVRRVRPTTPDDIDYKQRAPDNVRGLTALTEKWRPNWLRITTAAAFPSEVHPILGIMTPVVILDSNALHGRKPLSRADVLELLELSRSGYIRLVVPDVVLHEISRQWAERLDKSATDLKIALKAVNSALADVDFVEHELVVTSHDRSIFYDFARGHLLARRVEVPTVPEISVSDLLVKDLDVRKPFGRDGKGFRDALIWETVRALCGAQGDAATQVLFVTNNHADFCLPKSRDLHPDLRQDLPESMLFEIISSLHELKAHAAIEPLRDQLRVIRATFTTERVEELVDAAVADLYGADVEQVLGEYAGSGLYSIPITSVLEAPQFDEILFDNSSIASEIFRSGDEELTIRVVVDCDVTLTGFMDKSNYYMSDEGQVAMLEDWNSHVFRAADSLRVRFTLSAEFDEAVIEEVVLTVDEAEEL